MRLDLLGNDRKRIRKSFQEVKKDISELNAKFSLFEEELQRVREQLQKEENVRRSFEEERKSSESQPILNPETLRLILKEAVAEGVGKALKELNTKESSVFSTQSQPETEQKIEEIPVREEQNIQQPEPIIKSQKLVADKLKEDLLKNYERNRKDIIKQQILSEVAKGDLTKISLRDVVVDQKKYCSKASFYRYMDELELQGLVQFKRRKGRDLVKAQTFEQNLDA
ncbi:hypothetical protein GF367_01825 [Candidatus Woesearchaeota archaeon]|nr:hypothetical protein [Candidatus Woesearchaeota archaeon]